LAWSRAVTSGWLLAIPARCLPGEEYKKSTATPILSEAEFEKRKTLWQISPPIDGKIFILVIQPQ
jgi:hypothetical protein